MWRPVRWVVVLGGLLLSACQVSDSALVGARCDPADSTSCGDGDVLACDRASFACVLRGDETRDDGGARDAGPNTVDAGCPAASCPVDLDWSRWSTPEVTPPASAYTVTAGVVTDSVTGLTWQRGAAVSADGGVLAFPFVAAVQYCDGLTIDGSTGWRLPTAVELLSIVSYGASSPAVNVVTFPQTVGQLYWSATGATRAPATGWVVNFGSGATSTVTLSSACRVRCVK